MSNRSPWSRWLPMSWWTSPQRVPFVPTEPNQESSRCSATGRRKLRLAPSWNWFETVSEQLQKARFNKRPWKWKVGYFHFQHQNLQNSVQKSPTKRGWIGFHLPFLSATKNNTHRSSNNSNPCLTLNAILGDGPKAYSQCSKITPASGVRVLAALCYSKPLFGWQSCHLSGLSIMIKINISSPENLRMGSLYCWYAKTSTKIVGEPCQAIDKWSEGPCLGR